VLTFVTNRVVLSCDAKTGDFYGQVKTTLRIKGRPIPDNDIWIAALALQYDLALVTRDAHFNEVDTLSTEQW
jgi:tRNA(fMet)-specific endonuclease VapC